MGWFDSDDDSAAAEANQIAHNDGQDTGSRGGVLETWAKGVGYGMFGKDGEYESFQTGWQNGNENRSKK